MINESDIIAIVNDGVFGKVKYVASKMDNSADKGTQFASVINFTVITVTDGKQNIDYPVVIKKQHVIDEVKDFYNSDVSFRNEVIMYTRILPFLNADKMDLFPKLYHGTVPNETTLVFENVCTNGYRITKEKVYIDYDHIVLAMRKLGEFHGLSHVAKGNAEFYRLAKSLIETKFTTSTEQELFVYMSAMRGFQPLLDENVQVELLNKVADKIKDEIEVAKLLVAPEEPYSVICLGDFCRNNMFFKYDNGKPIDVKFFDLQNALYTSPAVDIAFFLYMNTTPELRNQHWDEFLEIYWNGLTSVAKNISFSYEQFLDHFAKRAIYGYYPTSFFLPTSLDETQLSVDVFTKFSYEDRVKLLLSRGGEQGTKAITEIARHLLSRGYLEKFLELFK